MKEFVLIDLCSQADAVWQYWEGWTNSEILVWLSQHGIITPHPNHPDSYWFKSWIGIEVFFRLTANKEFYVYLSGNTFHKLPVQR